MTKSQDYRGFSIQSFQYIAGLADTPPESERFNCDVPTPPELGADATQKIDASISEAVRKLK
jgi:hypothetical protein